MAMSLNEEDRQWIKEQLKEDRLWMTDQLKDMASQLMDWHQKQLAEGLAGLEARLTTAIDRRIGSLDMRQRGTSAEVVSLRLDMDDLKDRMAKLEGHAPPQ